MSKSNKLLVIAVLVGGNIIWGASYSVGKFLLGQMGPFTLMFLRFIIAVAVMLPFAWPKKDEWPTLRAAFPRLAAVGGIGITVVYIFQYVGMAYTTSSVAAILSITEPVALVIFARILFKEHLGKFGILGTTIALVGVSLLSVGDLRQFSLARADFWGNILLVLSMLGSCGYTLLSKPLAGRLPAFQVTAWSQLFATILVIPFTAWEVSAHGWPEINIQGWAGLLFVGVGCMALGYVAWNYCLARMPAGIMAAAMYLHPVVGVILGYLWLGEVLAPLAWVGGVLVLGGVALTFRSKIQATECARNARY